MPKTSVFQTLVAIFCVDLAVGVDVLKYLEENSKNIATAQASYPPRGTIIMLASKEVDKWFNLLGQGIGEYSGWYICDGRNGSPDLRGRFLVGRDVLNEHSDYSNLGATGGASHVTLTADKVPEHSHAFQGTTDASGQHSHSYYDVWIPDPWHYYYGWTQQCYGTPCVSVPGHAHVKSGSYSETIVSSAQQLRRETDATASHSHSFRGTTAAFGAGNPHENRPPYYVVVFAIYIGV